MSLLRGLKLEPLNEPLAAVALAKFQQRLGQLPGGFKVPDPKKLFFEGPEKAFDAAGSFWALAGKRGRRRASAITKTLPPSAHRRVGESYIPRNRLRPCGATRTEENPCGRPMAPNGVAAPMRALIHYGAELNQKIRTQKL
jgi:hypothetical protein